MKSKTLQLVARYDAQQNEYMVFQHNLTPEQAGEALRDLSAKLFSLFLIEQRGVHVAEDPQQCEVCRREVEHTAHLQPKPTFKRRME